MTRYMCKIKVESEYWVTIDANDEQDAKDEVEYIAENDWLELTDREYQDVTIISCERVYNED